MIDNLIRLYFFGCVAYGTREVWLPPHLYNHFPHDALFAMFYAACAPGFLAAGFFPAAPYWLSVGGGAVAFWLLVLRLGKITKRKARPTLQAGPSALPAGWEGWTSKRTFHTEWEDE